MYILVFRWVSRSWRNYFFNVKTKAVASDSRKKTVRNAVSRGGVRSSVRDVLLDLIGINFRICGI